MKGNNSSELTFCVARHQTMAGKEMSEELSQTAAMKSSAFFGVIRDG